ncbi:molybdopterin oxidoreductase [Allgaiera indica]|uniref:DMSO/TMAO reductase YedYZ, molybdopterin-dependent catalytic subunit n=1 Tax=Allgaiera indica TaxID=765699 RepID=A0AAN4UTE7_9RHOB|nr:molybdopterin-binding protein [Allgaiera indica]GHE03944.1 molybdopterin oxidoreductase [Allgaiera indica]SDX35251.1 DMSO/TMAO reductase YedYZ, molybdopterin-dependent catalytic subunit [Allgaiera indica]
MDRRTILRLGAGSLAATTLSGCKTFDFLSNPDDPARGILLSANRLTDAAQRLFQGRDALAPTYSEADIRQPMRPNGSTDPQAPDYLTLKKGGFADYRLTLGGEVAMPLKLSLADLRAMPQQSQITRHDCVEGWSCIAKWQGVRLSHLLDRAGTRPAARYVVFRCFDALSTGLDGPQFYYESIDLRTARHPQTILALAMNDAPLPVANGAPLRLRVERQLGYKMAKYVKSITLVSTLSGIRGGKGGYWEDRGYEWYAGV